MKKIMLIALSLCFLGSVMAADLSSVPASVKATILKYGTESEVTEIEKEEDENKEVFYYVTIDKESLTIYLEIDASGKLISKEEDGGEEEFEDEDE